MTTNKPLELLHMDLFDPIAYISIDGSEREIGSNLFLNDFGG
jgi:hypothetical protein